MTEQALPAQGVALLNRARVFANRERVDVVGMGMGMGMEGEPLGGLNLAGQSAGHEVEEKADVIQPFLLLEELDHLRRIGREAMADG